MFNRGTIVLVPFPFTDLMASKVRPALVVSRPIPGDDVILVFISSKRGSEGKYDVLVEPSKRNGLKTSSTIKCAKIATLDKRVILGELGALEAGIMNSVSKNLMKILV